MESTHVPPVKPITISRATLADRLKQLLDVATAENGKEHPFKEIADSLRKMGTPLSRGRWYYMRQGTGPEPQDRALLSNLATMFKVSRYYLTQQDGEVPERVAAQLELLQTMRGQEVRDFAARRLGDIDAASLRSIISMLDEELQTRGTEQGE